MQQATCVNNVLATPKRCSNRSLEGSRSRPRVKQVLDCYIRAMHISPLEDKVCMPLRDKHGSQYILSWFLRPSMSSSNSIIRPINLHFYTTNTSYSSQGRLPQSPIHFTHLQFTTMKFIPRIPTSLLATTLSVLAISQSPPPPPSFNVTAISASNNAARLEC